MLHLLQRPIVHDMENAASVQLGFALVQSVSSLDN